MNRTEAYWYSPEPARSAEKQRLKILLTWEWSPVAVDYLIQFEKLPDSTELLQLTDLEHLFKASWQGNPSMLLAAQRELAGFTIALDGDSAPCTLGFWEISRPLDWHPSDCVSEEFFLSRSNSAFSYSMDHAGMILFEDWPHSVNLQCFIEKQAYRNQNARRRDCPYSIAAWTTGADSIKELSQVLASKAVYPIVETVDQFGCVFSGNQGFGEINQSMADKSFFVSFNFSNKEVMESFVGMMSSKMYNSILTWMELQ